jgi:hypothetical protein
MFKINYESLYCIEGSQDFFTKPVLPNLFEATAEEQMKGENR